MSEAAVEQSGFGALLRAYRVRAGLSQNALARQAGVDPAYVNRIEAASASGAVVPRRPVVESLGRALGLNRLDTDRLLLAAGMAPTRLLDPGLWDSTVSMVVEVLADTRLTPDDRAEFRHVIRLLASRWRPEPSGGGAAPQPA